jgi:hypothetical protein
MMYRQGDVLFIGITRLPHGNRQTREDGIVAHGELTGHSHRLAHADRASAEVLKIGDHLYVNAAEASIFEHQEHGPITLPPGVYEVRIQREYVPKPPAAPEAFKNARWVSD